MYYVKRTFHAVGQGAFFTEEFYNDNGLNCCVVYDCGSNSAGQPQKAVDNYFTINHDHVDVLFISHFDSDHINGIDYLIKAGAINNETYVILPFRFPKVLIVFGKLLENVIESLIRKKAQLIGVSQLPDVVNNINPRKEPILIDRIQSNEIKKEDKISLSNLGSWFYVPFMTHDSKNGQALAKFEDEIENNGLDISKLNDIDYVRNNLKRIKDIYLRIPKLSSSRTSSINMNSLLLLSYPSEANAVESECNWDKYFRHIGRDSSYYHYLNSYHIASCLYTGDTGFDDIRVFDRIMNSVHQFCERPLGLLQIPHHGSIKNYNQDIALRHQRDYLIAFTNYGPRKNVFSNSVEHDLRLHEVPFITITDDSDTTFTQLILVN